ncbi:hypothetical protein A4G20_06510 [Pasteurellaceae bacterium RH1A]|nr:hypothetical protein A4G20_06510 [Pasteurellaceae bacterium RH1A]
MAHFQLDLRAYTCPLPLLMTKKALKTLTSGQVLEVWVNKSVARADFEALAQQLNLHFSFRENRLYFEYQ